MGIERPIVYRPAGALGLIDRGAVVQLLLDETEDDARPQDIAGALADLDPANSGTGVLTMPTVTDAVLGRGRSFNGTSDGLASKDIAPGASLLTRDMTIQVVMSWDVFAQNAHGTPASVVSRGLGGGAAEYVAYGLQLDVVDAPSFTGQARWLWQDLGGVLRLQAGGQFVAGPGEFFLLTATRRWVSPTSVRLRYYLGDVLLAEVISADGSIGGGTTGTFQLGSRLVGGVDSLFLQGVLDQVMIVGRELCAEEIESTWLRLTRYQPWAEDLYLQSHDPGYPLPTDPGTDARLEVRMVGHALGFVASHAEDLRANFLPGRAYGDDLANWEALTKPLVTPGMSIEERRARALARFRQRRGCSIPGLQSLLEGLLGGADPSLLQFLAFSNTVRDEFTTVNTLRWDLTPAACMTAVGGAGRFAPGAGTYLAGPGGGWLRAAMSVSQPGIPGTLGMEHVLARVAMVIPQSGAEVGIWIGDRAKNNYLLFGLRDAAGTFQIVSEEFVNWVSSGVVVRATLGANPAALWLQLYQILGATWCAEWSITSEFTGYTTYAVSSAFGTAPTYWAGTYLRSTGALGAGPVADVDMFTLRTPNGARPLGAYVLLDRALGFTPDLLGARQCVEQIKHAFVEGTFITAPQLIYGDADNGYGQAPCGGY